MLFWNIFLVFLVSIIGVRSHLTRTSRSDALFACEGIFRKASDGGVSISISKRYATTPVESNSPSADVHRNCESLFIRSRDDELDWTKIKKINLPNLDFFNVHIITNLTRSQFFQKAGWNNLFLFNKSGDVKRHTWNEDVLSVVTVNDNPVLEFNPKVENALKINWIDDPSSIIQSLVGVNIADLTLGNCKINNLDSINKKTLKSLTFQTIDFPNALDYIKKCDSLETLSISQLTPIENIDICSCLLSTSKNLTTVYLNNISVACGNDANFSSSPIQTLILHSSRGNLDKVNWAAMFPNLTNLAIVGHEPKSNPKLLKNVILSSNLKWIYMTEFDWKPQAPSDDQTEMISFIQRTSGDLNGTEENFILSRIPNTKSKWAGRLHKGQKTNLNDFQRPIHTTPPSFPYKATHVDIQIDAGEERRSSKLVTLIQEFKVWDTYLTDGAPLSITQAWRDNRNISITIDGNVLLNISQTHDEIEDTASLVINKLNASQILKNSKENKYGSGRLTKLALKDVYLDDLKLVEWAQLKELVMSGVIPQKSNEISIIGAATGLDELSLSHWAAQFHTKLDITKDIGSKSLRRLALRNVNLTLGNVPEHIPVFDKLEELYLCICEWDEAFEHTMWKAFPNLKILGVWIPEDDRMNAILLKKMLKNWVQLERMYLVGFEWTSSDPAIDAEIEKFVNLKFEDGELKSDFILERNLSGNTEWKAKKVSYELGELTELTFEVLQYLQNYIFHSNFQSFFSYDAN